MPSTKDANATKLDMANEVIGGSFTARLNMNLREDKHWSYGARTRLSNAIGQRPWLAVAPVQIDKTADSLKEMQREISEYASGKAPPTDDEIAKIKANEIRSLPGAYETAAAIAGTIVSNVRYARPDNYVTLRNAEIEALTPAQVAAAAKAIDPNALTWVVVGDLKQIEQPVRALKLGPVQVLDADGKPVDARRCGQARQVSRIGRLALPFARAKVARQLRPHRLQSSIHATISAAARTTIRLAVFFEVTPMRRPACRCRHRRSRRLHLGPHGPRRQRRAGDQRGRGPDRLREARRSRGFGEGSPRFLRAQRPARARGTGDAGPQRGARARSRHDPAAGRPERRRTTFAAWRCGAPAAAAPAPDAPPAPRPIRPATDHTLRAARSCHGSASTSSRHGPPPAPRMAGRGNRRRHRGATCTTEHSRPAPADAAGLVKTLNFCVLTPSVCRPCCSNTSPSPAWPTSTPRIG